MVPHDPTCRLGVREALKYQLPLHHPAGQTPHLLRAGGAQRPSPDPILGCNSSIGTPRPIPPPRTPRSSQLPQGRQSPRPCSPSEKSWFCPSASHHGCPAQLQPCADMSPEGRPGWGWAGGGVHKSLGGPTSGTGHLVSLRRLGDRDLAPALPLTLCGSSRVPPSLTLTLLLSSV